MTNRDTSGFPGHSLGLIGTHQDLSGLLGHSSGLIRTHQGPGTLPSYSSGLIRGQRHSPSYSIRTHRSSPWSGLIEGQRHSLVAHRESSGLIGTHWVIGKIGTDWNSIIQIMVHPILTTLLSQGYQILMDFEPLPFSSEPRSLCEDKNFSH